MSYLIFRYQYEGTPTHILDDFGWLEMRVVTERRSGFGGFWVQWQEVKEFGETLDTYPIETNAPLSTEWGFSENGAYEKVLGIEIGPANTRGDLIVRIEIADQHDPSDRLKASFQTNYPDLATFQTEVARLMAGEIEEARLQGQ
jgi:hypothetical protein